MPRKTCLLIQDTQQSNVPRVELAEFLNKGQREVKEEILSLGGGQD